MSEPPSQVLESTDSFGKVRQLKRWSMPNGAGGGRTVEAVDEWGYPTWGRLITVGPNPPSDPRVGDLWIATA